MADADARYVALEDAFWNDVRSRVGNAGERFDAFCADFRETWRADAESMGVASLALDDDAWRPKHYPETGQYASRRGGYFPGLHAQPWWDTPTDREKIMGWLEPIERAAPQIARELADLRCEVGNQAGPFTVGSEVVVTFPPKLGGEQHIATVAAVHDGGLAYDVVYEDGEDEAGLNSAYVTPGSGSEWLRRVRPTSTSPPLLYACGLEHVPLRRALRGADGREPFAATLAAARAARDAAASPKKQRLLGFSRQRPRTVLPAHSDLKNWILTCHVPLNGPESATPHAERVPPPSLALQAEYVRSRTFAPKADLAAAREMFAHALWDGHAHNERPGGSGMIVADEARAWVPGRALIFDTSFVHSAYNDGDAPTDYVHVDFFHPGLTADERRAITIFNACRQRFKAARSQLHRELGVV